MASAKKPILQVVDPRTSAYDRPDRDWRCAGADRGTPCLRGPDGAGRCGAGPACVPRRKGETWACARPTERGGPCDAGPDSDGACGSVEPPCRPKRSWRAARRWATVWAVLLVLGLVALGLGGTWMAQVASPGPLSAPHATVTDCADCHDTPAGGGVGPLLASALGMDPGQGPVGTEKCLVCHALGDHPTQPHGYEPGVLDGKWTGALDWARTNGRDGVDRSDMPPQACASCHGEHGGGAVLPPKDEACETCHAWGRAAFPNSHPPFQSYPVKRRTAIFYDHDSHAKIYFPDNPAQARTACVDCHVLADDGRRMAVGRPAEICAGCHEGPLADGVVVPEGVVVLNPPGLDVRALADKGVDIGGWPLHADSLPSASTRMLLLGDPAADAALAHLDATTPRDLEDADPETLAAAKTLAWATKGLMVDLYRLGPEAVLAPRLDVVLGRSPTDEELTALSGGLPREVLKAAMDRWFPGVEDEVDRHRAGEVVETVPLVDGQPWTPPVVPPPAEPTDGGDMGSILGDGASLLGDEGGILGGDSSILGGESILGEGLLDGEMPSLEDPAPEEQPEAPASARPEAAWAALGGWSERDLAIRYDPRAMVDPVIQAWLDLSGHKGFTRAGHSPFQDLAAPGATGACGDCHGWTGSPEAGLSLEWHSHFRDLGPMGTTVFRHAPHLTAPQVDGCGTCHVSANKSRAYQASYGQGDPLAHASNFEPMAVTQCAECHVQGSEPAQCLTCHRYHPNGVAPATPGGAAR